MTTPAGNPAWVRTSAFDTYGGDPNKANYQSQGVVNPVTDVGAEGFSRLASDVAAVARTAEFASMIIQCNDSSPAAPTIVSCRLMTGTTDISYPGNAAPAGFPTAARNGNGDITLTFASSYLDEYGVSGGFSARDPIPSLIGTGGGTAVPELVSDTAVRVRCFNLSAVAISNAKFSLTISSGG